MFVVEIGALVTTADLLHGVAVHAAGFTFSLQITLWLWFTVLFANFAEAMAEGRGKAQAETLRKARSETLARLVTDCGTEEKVPGSKLKSGDIVLVSAGEMIPGDGEIIEGIASVDESAITGESAPVIRESGGDRSAVTGGTRVLSDEIKIRITANPGQTFLDRMIRLVEGAERQKTPNEIALNILRGPYASVSSRRGYASTFRNLFERAAESLRPHRAFGLSHSDDHRRIAFRHRHRRNGSSPAPQRSRHVRSRR